MRWDDFLQDLKRRRVVRVVVGWAALVFVVLQVADLTFDALGLPDWAYSFLVVLSILGFPLTAGLAWMFDLTEGGIQRTPEREETAAPAGSMGLPNAAAVGVAVLVTVSAAAGVTWYLSSGGGVAGARPDDDVVAVTPFRVAASDPSLSYLREGAVDLMAAKLTSQPRAVDPRTLMASWRQRVGSEAQDLPRSGAVELAADLGAGRVLLGSIIGEPARLRVTATLLEVPSGVVVAETTLEGPADSIQGLLDGLASRLVGAHALSHARRFYRDANALVLLPVFRRLQGELAQELGDQQGAAEAFREYLRLRHRPDPPVAQEVAEVRRRLEEVEGPGPPATP